MRNGIIASGNWIIDHVKIIDTWPKEGMLANIQSEHLGTGGAPYNVLVDIAKLKSDLPLYAHGIIGSDHDGQYILDDLKANSIDVKHMRRTSDAATSYTDVMTVADTRARTFFHCRGANALLGHDDFMNIETDARIFHLGYLLLLDKLDMHDDEFGVVAARTLDLLTKKGYKTSVDVVSESSDRFRRIVTPCLRHTDYLILNEIEAGETTGFTIRDGKNIDQKNLIKAAEALITGGVRELVVIHFPEGGFAITKNERAFVPSFEVPRDDIKGTAGAGDAFCAGMLFAIHDELPLEDALTFANACARFNLLSPTCTGGAEPLSSVCAYIKQAKQNPPVVRL
ncbi:MAG: carbohydrate kinase family protein [Spirochaetes bacterium]|nr:carbohydrate kinase family protein [Spirochaetota bacterium]